jgi:hypothetical protein
LIKDFDYPLILCKSLNHDEVNSVVSENFILHIVFDYVITTHQFFNSEYCKPIPKDRQKLHNEIIKLHEQGWCYTKIHKHLRKNGFKIGKSRTTVDSILKKMKKKHDYLSQPIFDGTGNFRVIYLPQ